MKILVSDKLAQEGIDILKSHKEFTVDCKYNMTPDELKKVIKDYDALIIRSSTEVTSDILEAADKLRVIGRAGVGLDNVDMKAATKKGVVAMNTPAGNTTSTAEHTMSMILALSRNIPQAYMSMKNGKWDRNKFGGVELYGKTLGIIGLGRIGSTVAKFAKAFGMSILAFDPYLSDDAAAAKGVQKVELDKLVSQSDYITVHIPKSTETDSLISDAQFAKMKKTARLINCARGGIVDEKALAKALADGRIAGCALDVFEVEPQDPASPLLKLDNCVVTPHLGASTSEAQINVAIEIAEAVSNALLGKGIVNAANFPSVDGETYKALEPYNDLAMRMGEFSGQLIHGGMKEIKITYSGELTKYKCESVTLSLVGGLLKPIVGDTVNFLNALEVAKERGVKVEEVKSSSGEEFVNSIKIEVLTDKLPFALLGTLSANKRPRIVKINEVYVETVPEGNMLFINNNDKPGLVGHVGTVLAQANVNIAGISLGREGLNTKAVSVVNVDSEVSQAVIDNLKKNPDILFVKQVKIQGSK